MGAGPRAGQWAGSRAGPLVFQQSGYHFVGGAGGGMEVFSTQLLNYHLERREEVIKINLGRRSPEKSGGEVELMNFFKHRRK